MKALVKAGFNPNSPDSDGWTPLKVAAVRGNLKAYEALFTSKGIKTTTIKEASVFIKGWGSFLDKASIKYKDWLAGKESIDPVAMVKSKDLFEMLKLRSELERMLKHSQNASSDDKELVQQLIESLPSAKTLMQTALAQKIISEDAVKVLMLFGASLDDKDKKGETALQRAVASANVQQLSQILKLGAAWDLGEESPLFMLINNIRNQVDVSDSALNSCIIVLVKAGVDLNALDSNKQTIAHLIAKFGELYTDDSLQESITLRLLSLIRSKAMENLKWDLPDAQGKTGLDYAIFTGNEKLIAAIKKLLIK